MHAREACYGSRATPGLVPEGPWGNASVGIGARNGRSDEPHARLVCSCPSVMGGRDHVGWMVSLCWDPSEEDSMNHGGIFAFIWKSTFRGRT